LYGDMMHQSGWNLAWKCASCVYCCVQNVPLIGEWMWAYCDCYIVLIVECVFWQVCVRSFNVFHCVHILPRMICVMWNDYCNMELCKKGTGNTYYIGLVYTDCRVSLHFAILMLCWLHGDTIAKTLHKTLQAHEYSLRQIGLFIS